MAEEQIGEYQTVSMQCCKKRVSWELGRAAERKENSGNFEDWEILDNRLRGFQRDTLEMD